jgi:uncharacterized protein
MPGIAFVRVGVFCGVIVLVYYLAFRWSVVRLKLRRRPPRTAFERGFSQKRVGAVLVGAAVAGVLCMCYGFFVAPYRLTVSHHTIETDKIPKGKSIRIVHLADLHVREFGPREKRLPEMVRDLKPDLILHTGDFYARGGDVEVTLTDLLSSWAVPQYAVRGNLDRLGIFDETLSGAGVKILQGAHAFETVGDVRLCISGFPSGAEKAMAQRLPNMPSDTFNVVLYHHPEGFPATWDSPADLMLAGHTHGGQVCLPFYGALITMDGLDKRYESGRFDENEVTLIVSRGIGCEPHVPEVRFWCPPEVVVIDVVGTG